VLCGPDHLWSYQAYLFKVRKLDPGTVESRAMTKEEIAARTIAAE
jgi:hypothetical protein